MELIERYLYAVGQHLPSKDRKDIQQELRSVLIDNIDTRKKGSEPTEDEVIAVLQEFGPPEKVAAEYAPESQYLIGPTLFPAFRTTLGIAALVIVVVFSVLLGVDVLLLSQPQKALELLGSLPSTALIALGCIVSVFYVLQRQGIKPEIEQQPWEPKDLPQINRYDALNRSEVVIDLVVEAVLLVILFIFPAWTGSLIVIGGVSFKDPVLLQYLPLLVLSLALSLALNVWLLWRGRWTIITRIIKIVTNLFGLAIIALLIAGHAAWLQPYTGGSMLGYLTSLPSNIGNPALLEVSAMQIINMALVITAIVMTIETVVMGYQLVRQILEK